MGNLKKLVRPNIWALKPYSSAGDEYAGTEGIFLDANENPFGTLNRYPDPYQVQLKKKLADLKNVHASNVFIGNGSDEIIDLALRIFCNPGIDKAMVFTPTYGMYEVSAAINNVSLIRLPLNGLFQIDTKRLTSFFKLPRLKLIFICSPNNPTGNLMRDEDIEFILENFKGMVFIDEAYMDFTTKPSWLQYINKYNKLIVSQTFSKARGLAAARVGTAYAHAEVIGLFNKIKPPYNLSALNQQAALDSLDNAGKYEKNKARLLQEKTRLNAELQKLNFVKKVYPSAANFLLVEFTDANKVYADLLESGIVTRNRHLQIPNCLRISIGTPQDNDELLTSLKQMS